MANHYTVRKNQHGFTLVEIMIVVAIIGLLAAIAIPSFMRSRESAQQKTCISNLRQIESAKDKWAIAERKKTGDAITEAEVIEYIKNNRRPTCPAGGVYVFGTVSSNATCTITTMTHEQPR